ELTPNITKDLQSNSDHLEKDNALGSVLYQKNPQAHGIEANYSPDKAHESPNDYNPNVSKSSDDPFLQTQLKSTSARNLEKNSPDDEFRIKRGIEKYGENETLISKGVQHAIELKTNLENPVPVHSTLTKNTNIACIIVESPKFSGYLIAAMGSDRKMDNAFTRMLQRRLFEFLKSKGEQVSDQDVLNLKLQEVEFQDWSIEQADFLKKSIHEGSEIAMAFFPIDDTNVKLRESKSEKMAKISLKDLKPDTTLEFDLYLHLEANDRYILYTPQDGVFHASQKERLMAKGITDLHLRKDAVNNVKKYKAQNYLNEKIEAYKNKSKT
ncbi:MAG TPA: hypothetical protein PLJ21_12395, partial [Pseudobdellovibrionaceae bacterium]|nr:hypothetical protein [Pseudobdellovibrionaceae bacterium]